MSQNQAPIHLARQFEIIFTTHYSAVKYFAINLLKSEEDAEDIIQDVFAKLWTQPEVWLENKDIGQYIYAMTKNTTFYSFTLYRSGLFNTRLQKTGTILSGTIIAEISNRRLTKIRRYSRPYLL